MKFCDKMPCSLPHNHYCCSLLLPSPVCLPSPAHLYMLQLFTHCLPTIICVMLMSIVFFFFWLYFYCFLFFLSVLCSPINSMRFESGYMIVSKLTSFLCYCGHCPRKKFFHGRPTCLRLGSTRKCRDNLRSTSW